MTKIERFFANLKEKKVAFIGTGVTNNDIIRLFLKKGISITLLDRKTPEKLGAIYEELKAAGVAFQLGDTYLDHLTDFDVVFRSPGMYYHNEKLQAARKQGVVITTEMEVFFDLCPCKIYAVTGSDGKTTTTTLISEFLQALLFTRVVILVVPCSQLLNRFRIPMQQLWNSPVFSCSLCGNRRMLLSSPTLHRITWMYTEQWKNTFRQKQT